MSYGICLLIIVNGFSTNDKIISVFQTHGKDIVAWLVGQLASADNHTLPLLLKEIKAIAEAFPSILPEHMITISKYSDNGLLSVQIVIQQLKELSSKRFVN